MAPADEPQRGRNRQGRNREQRGRDPRDRAGRDRDGQGSSTASWLIPLLLAVVVVGALIWWFVAQDDDTEDTNLPSPTPSVSIAETPSGEESFTP
jgi:hypothetical protein